MVATVPTNTNGDLLLAIITVTRLSSAVITAPAGWVELYALYNGANTQAGYVRTASSEPANYTWSWSGAQNAHYTMMSISSPHGTTPIAGFQNFPENTGTPSLPNVALAEAADFLSVGALSCGRSTTINSVPTGYTNDQTPNIGGGSGTDSSIGSLVHKTVTAGAVPTSSWSLNNGTLGQTTQFIIVAAGTDVMSARYTRGGSTTTTSLASVVPYCYAGDRLLAAIQYSIATSLTITPPSGWTQVGTDVTASSGQVGNAIYEKVATGAEVGTTVTFTLSAAPSFGLVEIVSMPASVEVGTRASATDTSNDTTYDVPGMTLAAQTPACFTLLSIGLSPGNRFVSTYPTGYVELLQLYPNSSPLHDGALAAKGTTAANPSSTTANIGNGATPGPNIVRIVAYALGTGTPTPTPRSFGVIIG